MGRVPTARGRAQQQLQSRAKSPFRAGGLNVTAPSAVALLRGSRRGEANHPTSLRGGRGVVSMGGIACSPHSCHQGRETVVMAEQPP
eukprot:2437543-Amphidinium_carterae.1